MAMTTDEIFHRQCVIHFLQPQRFVQNKRDYSRLFVSALGVLCARYVPGFELFVPRERTEEQEEWIASNYGSLAEAIKVLRRRNQSNSWKDYRPLLVQELLTVGLLFRHEVNLYDAGLLEVLGWKKEDMDRFAHKTNFMIGFVPRSKWTAQEQLVEKRLAKMSEYRTFARFMERENEYVNHPKFNIAVVATMSAGKSTFINALLGHDYLPSRNEATTSTITSVQDKDGLQVLFGCVEREGELVPCKSLVTLEQMNQWNDDPAVSRIHLQGDLDNIGNHHAIVCVHDTPGTNNSGDASHEAITMEFLKDNQMDAVVFVANGEHLCTTDEKRLLEDLRKTLGPEKKIPVIFALNKMDSHDSEKEDLSATISQYRDFVQELGFDSSMVYPVTARAARLFKMALKGRGGDFTAKERIAFETYFHLMTENVGRRGPRAAVTVGTGGYPVGAISVALGRSGIPAIEQEINRLVERRQG